jgi:hypothetical protein
MTDHTPTSFAPSDAVEGGLPLDGATVEWTNSMIEVFDYKGKSEFPSCALGVDFVDAVTDESFERQYVSIGSDKDWQPTPDGKSMTYVGGGRGGVKLNSNFMQLMTSLVNAGYPEEELKKGDITILDGLVTRLIMVNAPKRDGVAQMRKGKDGKEYPVRVLVVESIDRMPGEKKKRGKAAAKKTTKKAEEKVDKAEDTPEDSGSDEDLRIEAITAISDILEDADGNTISKAKLPTALIKKLQGDPNRNKIIKLVNPESFHEGDDLPYVYDADEKTLSLT